MELAEVVFLVVFVLWLPAGALVGVLCEMARRGDEPMERACEEARVRDLRPVRRRDCERAR